MSESIVYRNLPSPLGEMIAAASDNGVCFLEWHDRGGVGQIKKRVEKRYKLPLEKGDNKHLRKLEKELAKYFTGKLKDFTVDIEVEGTTFQCETWRQLLKIPYGKTKSYGQLAKLLGNPGASRAIGRANGSNYLSVVIPCHRVINANGKLGGYGGKLWRKKKLLALESGEGTLDL